MTHTSMPACHFIFTRQRDKKSNAMMEKKIDIFFCLVSNFKYLCHRNIFYTHG